MKILLFGKNGQLGWQLQRSLAPLGEVIAVGKHDQGGDFIRPSEVRTLTRKILPDVIVNAAAYTAVDLAETNAKAAHMINAEVPGLLAGIASETGAWLIHYSTDYVFDGSGTTPWKEDDTPSPLNEYGRSKQAGEKKVTLSGCKHLVFRTSWVYATRGKNFAKTILRYAQERDSLEIVNDQVGAPTGASFLSDVTVHALRLALRRPQLSGIYHAAPSGETTWHGYAMHIIQRARASGLPILVAEKAIKGVPSSTLSGSAQRPANSRLDTRKLSSAFDIHLPNWTLGVNHMLDELLSLEQL